MPGRACDMLARVIESFVDLSYRGLPLGRRIKLTRVRPRSGYLELPQPMPVGTQISLATDEGVAIDAVVIDVHEQVGGSPHTPGMAIAPALVDDAARWWEARVALPDDAEAAATGDRVRSVTLRPRTTTIPMPPSAEALAGGDDQATVGMQALADDGQQTTVMEAIDPALLEQLMAGAGQSGELPVVDDGLRTVAMPAVDLSALGLAGEAGDGDDGGGEVGELDDAGASGSMAIPAQGDASGPQRGKRRKKRRSQ